VDKKRRYRERGDDHDELGLLLLARERPEKGLGCCEADGVGGSPDHKQRADHHEGTEPYVQHHTLHVLDDCVFVPQAGGIDQEVVRAGARNV
jgi:hypothetical protein